MWTNSIWGQRKWLSLHSWGCLVCHVAKISNLVLRFYKLGAKERSMFLTKEKRLCSVLREAIFFPWIWNFKISNGTALHIFLWPTNSRNIYFYYPHKNFGTIAKWGKEKDGGIEGCELYLCPQKHKISTVTLNKHQQKYARTYQKISIQNKGATMRWWGAIIW